MTRTPTNQSLRSFEAAARHLSFKRAAEELYVTPTAVSHQVKALENRLGCRLFARRARQVELTRQGQTLYVTLRQAFADIDACIERIRVMGAREVVTLGLGPIIGTRWLAPRLGDFWKQHGDIDLRLHHTAFPLMHSADQFDLAIAWGSGQWPSMEVAPFISIEVTPVMSPQLTPPAQPAGLLDFPLVHQRDRHGWLQWLAAAGVDTPEAQFGTVVDDANLVLQTALNGQGVVLGILPFVEDDIRAGRLLRPFDLAVDPGQAYYLINAKQRLDKPAVRRVHDWLLAQIGPRESADHSSARDSGAVTAIAGSSREP